MSWTRDSLAELKRIILLEGGIKTLSEESRRLIQKCEDMDHWLICLEAKFELLEHLAAPARRALPERTEK